MRKLAKVAEGLGLTMLFAGGCAMDSASIIAPALIAFSGLVIAFAGVSIEERYV